LELFPGRAKQFLSSHQAWALIATIKPTAIVGKTRRRLAVELIGELEGIDKKIKAVKKDLKALVLARVSTPMDLHGVGPSGAARLLADVGDIRRFRDRDRFASWTGTAPLDASSGEQIRHRLSRAGNRKMNHMLHIAAATQIRLDTEGRAYYRRKLADGKTRMEAMRCLKRRISDAVYRQLLADARRAALEVKEASGADPGGHRGASQESSAVDLPPHIDTSDQPLPGPANPTLQRSRGPEKTTANRPLTRAG
jgi:transposase